MFFLVRIVSRIQNKRTFFGLQRSSSRHSNEVFDVLANIWMVKWKIFKRKMKTNAAEKSHNYKIWLSANGQIGDELALHKVVYYVHLCACIHLLTEDDGNFWHHPNLDHYISNFCFIVVRLLLNRPPQKKGNFEFTNKKFESILTLLSLDWPNFSFSFI